MDWLDIDYLKTVFDLKATEILVWHNGKLITEKERKNKIIERNLKLLNKK